MSERDQSRNVAVGAGSPTGPDPDSAAPADDDEPGPPDGDEPAAGDGSPPEAARGDVVQAVAEFVDDLVDDGDATPDAGSGGG